MKNPFEDESYYNDIENPFEENSNSRIKQKIKLFATENKYKAKSYTEKGFVPLSSEDENSRPKINIPIAQNTVKNVLNSENKMAMGVNIIKFIFIFIVFIYSVSSFFPDTDFMSDEFTGTNSAVDIMTSDDSEVISFLKCAITEEDYKDFDLKDASFVVWEDVLFSIQEDEDYSINEIPDSKYQIATTYYYDASNDDLYKICFIVIAEEQSLQGVKIIHRDDNYEVDKQINIGNTDIPNVNIFDYV